MPLDLASHRAMTAKLTSLKAKTLTLDAKVRALIAMRSDDPLQQLQSDVIADLYAAIVALQDVTAPLFQALLPHVSGARDAAAHAGVSNKLAPPPFSR